MKDPALFTFFNEIGILAQLSSNAFERVLPKGLTVSQFSVLNHLVRLGDGVSPSRLAGAFQVTRGAMTNTLGKLEARGAIAIRPDTEDGRGKTVYLTARGRRLRDESIAALGETFQTMQAEFSENDFKAALPFLQVLRKWLDEERNPSE